ncbi:uncharacterized protein LOC123312055 [Coccinella septempunctata]|uniref:uncharacterized protein LOC123312055 n=1 Tax=Coccinella septempunctata TaxID=41139 RepID=UPI001D08984D|nr:uncharacterized protein LOC123312055 [Coccinella septempunctata]
MPRISKKRLNESATSTYAPVKASNLKAPSTNRSKKLKTIFNRLNGMDKNLISRDEMSRKLSTSSSTDSVIYVGSYKLNDNYSLIDLTKSMGSIRSAESFTSSRYTHVPNCHMFYTNLVQQCNLPCTASTSHLLDPIEGSKHSLRKNTKSASCLIVVNDKKNNVFRNSDFSKEMYSLNKKEKLYIDKITKLGEEDQNIIRHSLEIEEDINILELCSPQPLLTDDVPIETLIQTYHVDMTGQFS